MRTTHTYVAMEISPSSFKEIEAKLREADYQHAISMDGNTVEGLVMHGIMLTCAADERSEATAKLQSLNEEARQLADKESLDTETARIADGFGIPKEMLAKPATQKSFADVLAQRGSFHENLAEQMRKGEANFVTPDTEQQD